MDFSILSMRKIETWPDFLVSYLKVVFIWCPFVTMLFIFGFGGYENFVRQFTISLTIAWTVASFCFVGAKLVHSLRTWVRLRRGLGPKKSGMLSGMMTSYLFLVPGLYVGFELAERVAFKIGHTKWVTPNFNDYSTGIIFGILVSGLFTLFEVVRESKAERQASQIRLQALENEKLKAQVSALSAQMNPHLLFNSLNTIAATIESDPRSAEEMVLQLSDLYRGILKSAQGDVHSLENELMLCRSYLDIERKRFGTRVNYSIDIDAAIDPQKIRIPVLLLQPLVENAVKHGLAPSREGGRVKIDIRRQGESFLADVSDNGVGPEAVKPPTHRPRGTGTGLTNCESRIRLKYGTSADFKFERKATNETAVSLRLPYHEVYFDESPGH